LQNRAQIEWNIMGYPRVLRKPAAGTKREKQQQHKANPAKAVSLGVSRHSQK